MMMKNSLSAILLSAVSLYTISANATEVATNAALMQAMDKVTGRVNELTIPVNSKISFGDFSLVLRACKKRPAEETPENFAFIDVTDKSFGTEEYNIFRGWILSSTPGISAIEHPIYDVWLLECLDTEVDKAKLLSEEELASRDEIPSKQVLQAENKKEPIEDMVAEEMVEETPKEIHIKEFIKEDRDIEKDIKEMPAYISDTDETYVSDIEEGDEPENLLLFTKIQEVDNTKNKEQKKSNDDEDLSRAIDEEIGNLNKTKQ